MFTAPSGCTRGTRLQVPLPQIAAAAALFSSAGLALVLLKAVPSHEALTCSLGGRWANGRASHSEPVLNPFVFHFLSPVTDSDKLIKTHETKKTAGRSRAIARSEACRFRSAGLRPRNYPPQICNSVAGLLCFDLQASDLAISLLRSARPTGKSSVDPCRSQTSRFLFPDASCSKAEINLKNIFIYIIYNFHAGRRCARAVMSCDVARISFTGWGWAGGGFMARLEEALQSSGLGVLGGL